MSLTATAAEHYAMCIAGPSGTTVRQLALATETDIKSWTEPEASSASHGNHVPTSVRVFLLQVPSIPYDLAGDPLFVAVLI